MSVLVGLRARNPDAAVDATAAAMVLAAAILVPWSLAAPGLPARIHWLCVVLVALMATGAAVVKFLPTTCVQDSPLVTGMLAAGAVLTCVVNLLSRDASAAAQVFVIVPVLVAASQLRRAGAVLVTVVGVSGNLLTAALLWTNVRGWADVAVVAAVIIAVAAMLHRAAERTESVLEAMSRRVITDELTGVLRRDRIDELTSRALARGPAGLLMIDIDFFKKINDTYGHTAGDQALVHLVQVLGTQLRRTDCVVGRLGGDEMIMLLPGCPAEVLARRAGDVVNAVRNAPVVLNDGTRLAMTVSVGAAHSASGHLTPETMREAADAALYAAKAGGRDTHRISSGIHHGGVRG